MKETPVESNGKLCFSYIRFSSKKQELGSSLERQEPIAAKVAKEKGWRYEPKFNAKSLGVSAYKGDNKKTLESICDAAKQGLIPQGSVMVLEALDRATRLTLDDAQDLIKKILRSGIEIYTDNNKRHLTKESLNDVTAVIITAVELDAAFQYSNKLSNRSTGGFKKLVQDAQKGKRIYFGGSMPTYIKGVENGEWVEDLKRKNLVKTIFQDYLNGKSKSAIARDLNEKFIAGKGKSSLGRNDGKQWSGTSIFMILTNEAYTGDFTYKGIKIEKYLPVLVSKSDFRAVQYLLKQNTKRRGGSTKGDVISLFVGVGKCVCGASLLCRKSEYDYKGKAISHSYYQCNAARLNGCKNMSKGFTIKDGDLETDFIMRLKKSPKELIGESQKPMKDNSNIIKGQIAEQQTIIENAAKLLKKNVAVETIAKMMDEATAEIQRLESQWQSETAARLNHDNSSTNIESLSEVIKIAEKTHDDFELGAKRVMACAG
ncbi:MAG: recombinase family protein [Verrucomicrobiae bacterium]|nr:recombinase family protein [Verrucomicrobiae bacterium]